MNGPPPSGTGEPDRARREPEPPGGPSRRDRAFLRERLIGLTPKDGSAARETTAPPQGTAPPGTPFGPNFRQQLVHQYRIRQRAKQGREGGGAAEAAAPPRSAWTPIGPSVLRQGQGEVQPPTSGRVAGLAVAPGGNRIYAASAKGGVWRSDDAGRSWRSLMEGFDLNPTTAASDSLSCGAIAIVPGSPDRIYVGSGEGDTARYFGVGPIVSRDGGRNWVTEGVASGSPDLAGSAFYALAVDPANRERVVAGTLQGVYRREPTGSGRFHWVRKSGITGRVPSVVVARGSTTRFFAAAWGGPVYSSADGAGWTPVGTGFPSANVGRVGLAVQPGNPRVVYALVARADNHLLHGVYRLDTGTGNWQTVTGVPPEIFGTGSRGQGYYDLAIAVDPNDANRIYIAGSLKWTGTDWSGALWRCRVQVATSGVSMTAAFIGASIHADIHALVFTPGESRKLWVGCDGGVFFTSDALGTGNIFEPRNTGLATLTLNHLGQHPVEDAVLFAGTQDNGGIRYTGEEAWLYSSGGDAGYQIVNWADPYRILSSAFEHGIRRSTDGGNRRSYTDVDVPFATGDRSIFYAPLVGTPPSSNPADAEVVAYGSTRPWISTSFGGGWRSIPHGNLAADSLGEEITALAFASARRLYAATIRGRVYRFDRSGTSWTRTRIDTVGGTASLTIARPVTDIAVDPANTSGGAIYVAFGGIGDYRHVWHFDGARWAARSGPAAGNVASLVDVQASALAIDPRNPRRIFAGADIGVWESRDGGATWAPFSEGLPDAPVIDLQIHPRKRLLRAATHGRGAFERPLDATTGRNVSLYVRDHQLDRGLFITTEPRPDPTRRGFHVMHYQSPDIKLDSPDANGRYRYPAGPIDVLQFPELKDEVTGRPTAAVGSHPTRVYVQVHNRGLSAARDVTVLLLATHPSAGLPPLPAGFASSVQSGTPITSPFWRTVGFMRLNDVRAEVPRTAVFSLSPSLLAPPSGAAGGPDVSLLAIVHHADDPFTGTQTSPDALALNFRKVAVKSIGRLQFGASGTSPRPKAVAIRLHNPTNGDFETSLLVNLRRFAGRVRLHVPAMTFRTGDLRAAIQGGSLGGTINDFRSWGIRHADMIRNAERARHGFDRAWSSERRDAIDRAIATGVAISPSAGSTSLRVHRIKLPPRGFVTCFLLIDRPPGTAGAAGVIEVLQTDDARRRLLGGLRVAVEVVATPVAAEGQAVTLPQEQLRQLTEFARDANAHPATVLASLVENLEMDPSVRDETRRRLELGSV